MKHLEIFLILMSVVWLVLGVALMYNEEVIVGFICFTNTSVWATASIIISSRKGGK